MQQRYYEPVAGRFLSVDPVTTDAKSGGHFNRYVYAENSPYKFKDPDGRLPVVAIVPFVVKLADFTATAIDVYTATQAGGISGGAKALVQNAIANAVPGAKAAAKVADKLGVADGAGRAANKLKPVEGAEGAHSTFKRGPDGQITNTATYTPNSKNPSGFDETTRVDVTGKPHTNSDGTKVPTPHVHEAGQKDVRPAKPDELPKRTGSST
jgi:uncharacterized protein RhaS with RHS repeats